MATYDVAAVALGARGHAVEADCANGRILRSVVMKPESELIVEDLHSAVVSLVSTARESGPTDSATVAP